MLTLIAKGLVCLARGFTFDNPTDYGPPIVNWNVDCSPMEHYTLTLTVHPTRPRPQDASWWATPDDSIQYTWQPPKSPERIAAEQAALNALEEKP